MLRQATVILIITLVFSEIALRIVNKVSPTFIFYDNSYNRFRVKPFARDYNFRVNSKGFKDLEYQQSKQKGTCRILGIGDSFTWGIVPYQNNYLTILEENLNREGKKTEVINMGIPGTGPRDYLSLFVNEGLPLKPDMVIVSFFIGNDFEDKAGRPLYSYSYVASLAKYLFDLNSKYESAPPTIGSIYNDTERTFSDQFYLKIALERSEIYRKQNPPFQAELSNAMTYLVRMNEICKSEKIPFVVVLIPDEVQVNPGLRARVLQVEEFSFTANAFDFTLPNRLLSKKLEAEHIVFIDLLDEFARTSTQASLYKPNDSHWNIMGNRLAAELILRHMPICELHGG